MLLKKFDFLSPKITLYYNNEKRHSSYLGGLLTIIMLFLSIYIIIHYSFKKVYPSGSSLLIYRNYDKEINMFFNQTELFHYLWIFNNEILDNNINQNLIQLNNLKKGVIRIYMTYSYDKYQYNSSSNLKDNDHWVYDTCSSYFDEEDFKYDYSLSSCIKYYYNSDKKKYYSINDYSNFKWPFIRKNSLSNYDNKFFGIFVEKCDNNSIINEILGECYSEEKINEYLYYFNNIFLSIINSKIQMENKNEPVKLYSHKIYDKLIGNQVYFYIHDLLFIPINYRRSNGLAKTIDYSSFILDEDIQKKIYNFDNNKLLIAYILNHKQYTDELRQKNNYFLEILNETGGSIFLIYIFFYGLNYFFNKIIIIKNFQMLLSDKNSDLIHRNINYERNKIYSLKSNEYTNLSNDINNKNEGFNSFKSTYLGNFLRNDLTNLTNVTNINNNFTADDRLNQKNNDNNNNNYTIKINRIDKEDKDGTKKSDNIIVINNNSFMNENSNNKYILNRSLDKYNSLKLINKHNNLENLQEYHKTFTYNKSSNETQSLLKLQSLFKNNKLNNLREKNNNTKILNIENSHSKRIDSSELNSKQKIVDTSSISLLNSNNQNKIQNLFIDSYNNDLENNSKAEKMGLNVFSKINTKIQNYEHIIPRHRISFKQLNNKLRLVNNVSPGKNSRKENKYTYVTSDKGERRKRRKSHQIRNDQKIENNINEKYKSRKAKTRKTGAFLKLPDNNKEERHLSLFSKHSGINNDNTYNQNEKNVDDNSHEIRKSFIENLKRYSPTINPKRKIKRQSSEVESRSIKKNKVTSVKNLQFIPKNEEFANIIKNYRLSAKSICNFICKCNSRGSGNYILNNFREKLLSEENLYILHINMFIFKQKYGCKSTLSQLYLLEELYNDY